MYIFHLPWPEEDEQLGFDLDSLSLAPRPRFLLFLLADKDKEESVDKPM